MLTFVCFLATIWVFVYLPIRCLIAFCQGYLGAKKRQALVRAIREKQELKAEELIEFRERFSVRTIDASTK